MARYNAVMETVSRTVGTLQPDLRQAMEAVVGHSLEANQQLIIQIVDATTVRTSNGNATPGSKLPAWCSVLTDLTDEEAAALDSSIAARTESRDQPPTKS
jgi:hypothetical protein